MNYDAVIEILKVVCPYGDETNKIIQSVKDLRDKHESDTWQIGEYSNDAIMLEQENAILSAYANSIYSFACALACETTEEKLSWLESKRRELGELLTRLNNPIGDIEAEE